MAADRSLTSRRTGVTEADSDHPRIEPEALVEIRSNTRKDTTLRDFDRKRTVNGGRDRLDTCGDEIPE